MSNNGLMTKIWGPPLWKALHCITFGYPEKPTQEQKDNYRQFLTTLGTVLPCSYCRDSYTNFISEGENKLTDADLISRDALTEWFYKLHNRVNNKLGMNYGVSFEDIQKTYESFRAKCSKSKVPGCVTALDWRAQGYINANKKDCPIIPKESALKFIPYAKERGLDETEIKLISLYEQNLDKFLKLKKCDQWCKRNKECDQIITQMREGNISCLENDGPYKGLPTMHELKLIVRLCSNMCNKEIEEVIENLGDQQQSEIPPKKIIKVPEPINVVTQQMGGKRNKKRKKRYILVKK